MPSACIVPGCRTGRKGSLEKISTFSAPGDAALRSIWERNIGRANFTLKATHRICEKHFPPADIVRSTVHLDTSGNVVANVPLSHPRLVPNAVPVASFGVSNTEKQNTGESGQKLMIFCKQQEPEQRILSDVSNRLCISELAEEAKSCEKSRTDVAQIRQEPLSCKPEAFPFLQSEARLAAANESASFAEQLMITDLLMKKECLGNLHDHDYVKSAGDAFVKEDKEKIEDALLDELFDRLNHDLLRLELNLPENWYACSTPAKNCIAFSEFELKNSEETLQPVPAKSLLIGREMRAHYSAYGKAIPAETLSLPRRCKSVSEISSTLQKFALKTVCRGIGTIKDVNLVRDTIGVLDCVGNLRHKNCSIVAVTGSQCGSCKNVRKLVTQKKLRLRKSDAVLRRTLTKHGWLKVARAQRIKINRYKEKLDSCRDYVRGMESYLAES